MAPRELFDNEHHVVAFFFVRTLKINVSHFAFVDAQYLCLEAVYAHMLNIRH